VRSCVRIKLILPPTKAWKVTSWDASCTESDPLWFLSNTSLAYRSGKLTAWNSSISLMFCATAPISTIFFTLLGLSIATLGAITVPSLWPNTVILLLSTSGCCVKTAKALFASCSKSLIVRFPHTLLSKIVWFVPTPLLSYRSVTNPRSDKYSAIWNNGVGG
jgi:hypothetical protein